MNLTLLQISIQTTKAPSGREMLQSRPLSSYWLIHTTNTCSLTCSQLNQADQPIQQIKSNQEAAVCQHRRQITERSKNCFCDIIKVALPWHFTKQLRIFSNALCLIFIYLSNLQYVFQSLIKFI